MRAPSSRIVLGLALTLLLPSLAFGYATSVHTALAERSLRGRIVPGNMPVPTQETVVKFWLWFGTAMAGSTGEPALDGGDPEKFRARYPDPRAFDAFAIRGFLALRQTPEPAVWGLERFDERPALDRFNVTIEASAYPDKDERNQRRYAYDAKRQPLKLPDGRHVPADPMILNMGGLEDLSSQAHAHYQLAADKPSADPAVLNSEPWNFVIATGFPGAVETYAAAMAQLHLDVAVLAHAWGEGEFNSTGDYLGQVWLGAGLHYVQDVSGPLHAVQVGSYTIFEQAQIEHWKQALLTGGGTWGDLRSFPAIGTHWLRNHHLVAEQWLAREIEAVQAGKAASPVVAAAWNAADQDDPELLKELGTSLDPFFTGEFTTQPWDDGEGAGSLLVHALAKIGRRDGKALYEAAFTVGAPRLREMGYLFGDDEALKPEHLRDPADPEVAAALKVMADIHARSIRRAATAARLYFKAFQQGNSDAAARRLRRTRLRQLDLQEKRLERYLKAPPPATAAAVHAPVWLYGELGAAAGLLLVGAGIVRIRRRRARPTPPLLVSGP